MAEPQLEGAMFVDRDGAKCDFDDVTWNAAEAFFRDQPGALVAHQLDSYNDAMTNLIPAIIHAPDNNPVFIKSDFNSDSGQHQTEYQLTFGQVSIGRPVLQENSGVVRPLTPNEARIRSITYAANLYVDVEHRLRYRREDGNWGEWESEEVPRVLLCRMPLMLGSKYCILSDRSPVTREELGECLHDDLGYFLINGQEKVLISTEKIIDNRVLVFESSEAKFSDVAEVRSTLDGRYMLAYTTKVRLYRASATQFGRTLRVWFHNIKADIPLFILFRALGVSSDKAIFQMCVEDLEDTQMVELLKPSLEEALSAREQVAAIEWISRSVNLTFGNPHATEEEREAYRIRMVHNCLVKFLLPHAGDDPQRKALMLGVMVNKLLSAVLGRSPYTDRDSFVNKRIDTPGPLIGFLFGQNLSKKLVKTFEKDCRRELLNFSEGISSIKLDKLIKPPLLDTGIRYSFGNGVWGLKSSVVSNRVGVSQLLSRINTRSALAFKRRVISTMDKSGKSVVGPRKLHPSHWGVICPAETPDGEGIGLNKYLALTAYITNHVDPEPIIAVMLERGLVAIDGVPLSDIKNGTKVFVNGEYVGVHFHAPELVAHLREQRRNAVVHIHTSIAWHIAARELHVHTDAGRLTRPLYIVEDGQLLITDAIFARLKSGDLRWNQLLGVGDATTAKPDGLNTAVVEYVDVAEAETCLFAMSPADLKENAKPGGAMRLEYTHCEIHPSLILSSIICGIPFSSHDQAPRVIYYGQMGKQSIGIPSTQLSSRFDTVAHVLHYGARPLVTTRPSELIKGDELPAGQTVMVAVCAYTGYNQEDSIIVNEAAVKRGLFTTTAFKTTKEEERKNQLQDLQEERFRKPDENTINAANYDKIDQHGLPIKGRELKPGDVVVGKVAAIRSANSDGITRYRDVSARVDVGGGGVVDNVVTSLNGDGYRFAKVKLRKERPVQIGDKLMSRHSQKGICGLLLAPEDMPFNRDGLTPDIIINPHAMPSRMTIGQFLESVLGKACAMKGCLGDGTPFNSLDTEALCSLLGTPLDQGGAGFTEVQREDGSYAGYGDEAMYNGMTGELLNTPVFFGPCYYLRSKHQVEDKFHSRATGPTQLLTRQPPEGRARHGSSRLGEMERDCLLAHGTVAFLKEKFVDSSDLFPMSVDRNTGMFAVGDSATQSLHGTADIKSVRTPYAYKLLSQELNSIGIAPRLRLA